MKQQYWQEAISEMFSEHGITATPEQIKLIADDVILCAGSIHQAFPDPAQETETEADKLRRELRAERAKRACEECGGRGSIVTPFGPVGRVSVSGCDRCRGAGKV